MRVPSASSRYRPTPKPTAARGLTPRLNGRTGNVRAPRVRPGTAAPRLGTPLTLAPTLRAPTTGRFNRSVGTILGSRVGRRSSLFRGYFGTRAFVNNCFYQPWSFGIGWNNWNCGWGYNYVDPFCSWGNGFGFPLSPWSAYRAATWNGFYNDCYWNSWNNRGGLSWNFWWYPRSTYCPTYLYVPSSVVVYDDTTYVDGTTTETVVAGSSVAGMARSVDVSRGSAEEPESPEPITLATKYVELGDFYFKNGRYDEAATTYAKARSYAPNDASVHFVLADAVFANGDYHYAAFLIAEAVRLDPTIVTAEVDKRTFYGDAREFDAQMAALRKYIAGKPYDAWAHLVLAYNLRFSDSLTSSIAAFRKVLELDKGNPTAQAFLDHLMPPKVEATPDKAAAPAEKAKKKVN